MAINGRQNHFLAALPEKQRNEVLARAEVVSFRSSDVLWEAGDFPRYVYFPTTCVVSFLSETEDGAAIEVGMIGREGVAGHSSAVGFSPPYRAIIQIPGAAIRAPVGVFKAVFEQRNGFHDLLVRFVVVFTTQVAQSVVCNRFHHVEERLARWLLLTHDRVGSNTLNLTQEFISHMLGTRRASVTVAAGMLQEAGIIDYKRGRVTIIDRPKLEAASCECYQVIRDELAKFAKSISD
jgi:CRP-like cAMP-binding protein